jgi:hypothetical protein
MDIATAIATLNRLLTSKEPAQFNSSWIRRHAPRCYRFIQLNFRREYGGIDWDRLTCALERRFQGFGSLRGSAPLCAIESLSKDSEKVFQQPVKI